MTLLLSLASYLLASLHMHTSHISSNNYSFPVNHHPWELKTPFIICLITLSLHSAEDKLTINSLFCCWERERELWCHSSHVHILQWQYIWLGFYCFNLQIHGVPALILLRALLEMLNSLAKQGSDDALHCVGQIIKVCFNFSFYKRRNN